MQTQESKADPKLRTAALVLAGAVALASCGGPETTTSLDAFGVPHRHRADAPPNVILVVLDTARADRMSYAGHRRITTPQIDALARDGVVYGQAHSVAPWTLPSHMSMFTGLLPGQHGATWHTFDGDDAKSLDDVLNQAIEPPESYFLPSRLRRFGYSNVGFSANAWIAERTGFDRGFDSFYEVWRDIEASLGRWHWPSSTAGLAPELASGDAGKVLIRLEEHLAENGELREPFFLFFNFIDPHFPYAPPELWRYAFSRHRKLGEKIAKFRFSEMALVAGERRDTSGGIGGESTIDPVDFEAFYDAEMSYVDFAVGRLVAWLKEKEYYDESLIVVVSDHGEHLGEKGRFSHQFSVEEELLRIPLVIKYPGQALKGSVVESPLVSNLDVYATILAVAAAGRTLEGPATPSRNLAEMDRFDRAFLIAESYYSRPFLRAHQEVSAAFPIDEHRVVRRVVFDETGRFTFLESGAGSSAAAVGSPEGARAAAVLRDYVSSLGDGLAGAVDRPLDKATLERLRGLGYVN